MKPDQRGMHEVDLSAPDVVECPYRLYQRLHDVGGGAVDPNVGVLVTRYDDLVELSRRTGTFSSSISEDGKGPRHMGVGADPVQEDVEAILAQAHPVANALFTADPPVHTRHRKLISKALSPRRVRDMEPYIRRLVAELIDAFIDDAVVDLLPQFAIPLPLTVISDILGVDRTDMATFKHWGDEMISGNLDVLDHQRRREVAAAVVDFHRYFVPRIEERRANPRDDLLSDMVNAEVDGEGRLTTAELLPIISQILLAGHETTTNLIANALVVLLRRPELLAGLRAKPARIPMFIEEVLRFDPPVQCTFRRATADTAFAEAAIRRGQMVVPMWAAAGWDPEAFDRPEVFDPDRDNVRQHMGFGHGPHFCAGAELARLEATLAFEALLERLGNMRLDEQASDLARLPSFSTHGYRRVVIGFDPPSRG